MDSVTAIELVAKAFGLLGVLVTVYGGAVAAVHLAKREFGRSDRRYRDIRCGGAIACGQPVSVAGRAQISQQRLSCWGALDGTLLRLA